MRDGHVVESKMPGRSPPLAALPEIDFFHQPARLRGES